MSATKQRRAGRDARRPVRRFGASSILVLAVAFAAGGLLLVSPSEDGPPAPPSRSSRELRSVPVDGGPMYGSFASTETDLIWVESSTSTAAEIWSASLRDARSPARRLTADTGAALFYGSQYDLIVNGGRVYWAAARAGTDITEIRSIPVTGGAVSVRTEQGQWALAVRPGAG